MNDGVNRGVLVIYAAVLGWYACRWWQFERERIVWDAADELQRRPAAREQFVNVDQPAAADTSGAST